MVPKFIVKLVAATEDASKRVAGLTVVLVLQVTPKRVPVTVVSLSNTKISLFAVTAVVFTVHVPVEAFVAQENCPAGAAAQDATEGLAAVPTAAQFVAVLNVFAFTLEAPPGDTSTSNVVPTLESAARANPCHAGGCTVAHFTRPLVVVSTITQFPIAHVPVPRIPRTLLPGLVAMGHVVLEDPHRVESETATNPEQIVSVVVQTTTESACAVSIFTS